ncbi:hypothetical protein D3C78_1658360 [compost metagenome]
MQHGARQIKTGRVALPRQFGQRRAARITQPHQLGRLVEGFASRVIQRFAQQFVAAHAIDAHQLRMAA